MATTVFWAAGAAAFTTSTIVAAIQTSLATSILPSTHMSGLALAASVLDIIALPILVAAITLGIRQAPRRSSLLFHLLSTMILLVGLSLTLFSFGWTESSLVRNADLAAASSLVKPGFVFWVLDLITLAVFYTLSLWPQDKDQQQELPTMEINVDRPSPVRSTRRSLAVHLGALAPSPPRYFKSGEPPVSPIVSIESASSRSSFRNSMSQVITPMTSKTRLLIRTSFHSSEGMSVRSSGRQNSFVREENGFEKWDTSTMEDGTLASPDAFTSSTAARVPLETIPGSRPVSPAKPLEGLFGGFDVRTAEETPLPPSPPSALYPFPKSSSASTTDGTRTPPLKSWSSLSSLRQQQSASSQSHVHPLFRPESPGAPPIASPRTVITASPLAGQVVSPGHAFGTMLHGSQKRDRSWSCDRPVFPISRPGSAKSFRMHPGTLIEEVPSSPLSE